MFLGEPPVKTKICSRCKKELPVTNFTKSVDNKDGLDSYCRSCKSKYQRQYHKNNREILLKKQRESSKTVAGKATRKKYIETNKENIRKYHSEWYLKNKEAVLLQCRTYRHNNKKKAMARYYKKMASDPEYRISLALRARLRNAVKEQHADKLGKTFELVGCSSFELQKYLESIFLPGMTWDNYGRNGWHIDHIIPCAFFDLTKLEEQKKCFHWSNLQPMWWLDNVSKASIYKGKRIRIKPKTT